MAKNTTDEKPRKRVELPEVRKRILAQEDWFVAYHDTTTRDAIAQGLQLVDSSGDQIFYDGKPLYGFRISFDTVLFLVKSRPNGVFRFTPYHKAKGTRTWRAWKENKKTGEEHIRALIRQRRIRKAV